MLVKVKHAVLPALRELLDVSLRSDDLGNGLDLLFPPLHILCRRLGMYDVKMAVVAAHVDLQSSVVADHIQISGFPAAGKRVEVVHRFAFSDDAALGENGIFVGFETKRSFWTVLLDVVGLREECVELSAAVLRLVIGQDDFEYSQPTFARRDLQRGVLSPDLDNIGRGAPSVPGEHTDARAGYYRRPPATELMVLQAPRAS